MNNIREWSFLWENPKDYLIVKNSALFPNDEGSLIFDMRTRLGFGLEDGSLNMSIVQRMRQAGVQTVESREFHAGPSEATLIVETGHAAGLSREEINRRLRALEGRLKEAWCRRRMGLDRTYCFPIALEEEWRSIRDRKGVKIGTG